MAWLRTPQMVLQESDPSKSPLPRCWSPINSLIGGGSSPARTHDPLTAVQKTTKTKFKTCVPNELSTGPTKLSSIFTMAHRRWVQQLAYNPVKIWSGALHREAPWFIQYKTHHHDLKRNAIEMKVGWGTRMFQWCHSELLKWNFLAKPKIKIMFHVFPVVSLDFSRNSSKLSLY